MAVSDLDLQPVLVELQRAVQLAQAVGHVFKGERRVLEVDAAPQAGIHQRAVRLHLEGGVSAGGEVGVEGLGELQVDGAAGGKVQLLLVLEREASLGVQVGLFAGDVQRIEMDDGMVERGMDAALALEMNAGNRDRQLLQAGLAAQLGEPRQRPLESDRAGQRGLAVEALHMGQLEQRADVEAGKIEFGLGGIVASQLGLAVRLEVGRLQPGCQVVGDGVVGGVRLQLQLAQRFPVDCEAGQDCVHLKTRIVH